MTTHTTLTKDLTTVVSELEAHITKNNIDVNSLQSPYIPFVSLGSSSAVSTAIPSLASALNTLTIKTAHILTVYATETISKLNQPYIIIPIRNGQNVDLVFHDLKSGATEHSSTVGFPYYLPEDTTDTETVHCAKDTIYIVNANQYHSFRINFDVTAIPYDITTAGLFLLATVNEDLSGYFA